MSRDPTADDAAALLLAIIANRPNTPKTEAFTPVATDAERAGLEYHPNRARFDGAMWRLIDDGLVERDEDAEHLLTNVDNVEGLADYDYGRAFRITERGRKTLKDAGFRDQD
jgi:hypothetical protein